MSKRYKAKVRISYPADPEVVRRIRAGERVPPEERGEIISIPAGTAFEIDTIPAHARMSVLQFAKRGDGRLVEIKTRRRRNG